MGEPLDEILASSDLVDSTDQLVPLGEHVPGMGAVEQLLGDDVEAKPELVEQLVLPLVGQASGCDHQDAFGIAPDDQLFDVEARHDRLARAGVVGEQEPQGLAGEHFAVDGFDLVGERVDLAGGERQVGVEEMGQMDAAGFGGQPEEVAVAVKAPGATGALVDLEGALVAAVEQLFPRLLASR